MRSPGFCNMAEAKMKAVTPPSSGCAARIAGCRRFCSSRPRPAVSMRQSSLILLFRTVGAVDGARPSPCAAVTRSRQRCQKSPCRSSFSVSRLWPLVNMQRQHAHADQVRAVDALKAFDDDSRRRPADRCLSPPSRATSQCRTPCRRSRPAARLLPYSAWRIVDRITSPDGRCLV